jgi:glutamyl-tRNA synthetase
MVEGTYKNKKTGEYQMAVDENGMPVLDENGNPVKAIVKRKMSKSQGDPSFEDLLAQGYLVEAVINYLVLLGWSPKGEREFFTLKELEEVFDLEGLSKSPSVFDIQKLNWFNAEYIRKLSPERYLELATPWLEKVLDPNRFDFKRLAELLQGRTEVFNQLPDMVRFLAELPDYTAELFVNPGMKVTPEVARTALALCGPVLEAIPEAEWQGGVLYERLCEAITAADQKKRPMLWSLAAALAGQQNTPGGATDIAYLLGKEETLRRLALGREKLAAAE